MEHTMTRIATSRLLALAAILAFASGPPASAAEPVRLIIKDHRFTPAEVSVPANERFRIEVENQDATPAELESTDLRVEKVVTPGGKITVMAGPLKPGVYTFADEYHPDTAKGTLTAVEQQAGK